MEGLASPALQAIAMLELGRFRRRLSCQEGACSEVADHVPAVTVGVRPIGDLAPVKQNDLAELVRFDKSRLIVQCAAKDVPGDAEVGDPNVFSTMTLRDCHLDSVVAGTSGGACWRTSPRWRG